MHAQAARPITVEEFRALIRREAPFGEFFGLDVDSIEPGRVRARHRVGPEYMRPGNIVCGPVSFTLADFTMYALVLSLDATAAMATTTDLSIRFLRAAKRGDLVAEGRILKAGKRLVVCDVLVRVDGEPDTICHATGTYSIPPKR
jgi:uncharacterized protein (TIGR00369 family)